MTEAPKSLDGFRSKPVLNDELVHTVLTALPELSGETRIRDLIPYQLKLRPETEALAPWRAVVGGLDSKQQRVLSNLLASLSRGGMVNLQELRDASPDALVAIRGISPLSAAFLKNIAPTVESQE